MDTPVILKRTALFPIYQNYGGKAIDFGGWELPVQFGGIIQEHEAVRKQAGLFDVSHMGEVLIQGKKAEEFIQFLMTNDMTKLKENQALYTAMCYPDGGTVDDLLVYKLKEEEFLLVINAANIETDVAWITSNARGKVAVKNISKQVAQLAIQGPKAEEILQKLTVEDLSEIQFFHFKQQVDIDGIKALVSRTGYTGEDGFELYSHSSDAVALWEKLIAAGKEEGILPCGLGARDTLRFEARLPLYGQELTKNINPLEAGIGFAVKTQKEADFIGKKALLQQKEVGLQRKIVGLEVTGRGIPRHGYPVYTKEASSNDEPIGYVTSGTHSPSLKKSLGLALLPTQFTEIETPVQIGIRDKRVEAKVVKAPFYKREK
jgi:aminomethyltransferase